MPLLAAGSAAVSDAGPNTASRISSSDRTPQPSHRIEHTHQAPNSTQVPFQNIVTQLIAAGRRSRLLRGTR